MCRTLILVRNQDVMSRMRDQSSQEDADAVPGEIMDQCTDLMNAGDASALSKTGAFFIWSVGGTDVISLA